MSSSTVDKPYPFNRKVVKVHCQDCGCHTGSRSVPADSDTKPLVVCAECSWKRVWELRP